MHINHFQTEFTIHDRKDIYQIQLNPSYWYLAVNDVKIVILSTTGYQHNSLSSRNSDISIFSSLCRVT